MPANLTPAYLAAEARFRASDSNEEKLAALEEMHATIPKHKGTEKLQADIKRRMSKLRERDKSGKVVGHADEFHIPKQGAGQIVVIGPANSGKSSIIDRLTSAQPEIADYEFTTQKPLPGMMEFEDVAVQLVDTPPISTAHFERGLASLTRNADAVAVVLDCSDDILLDRFEEIRELMSNSRTVLAGEQATERDYPAGTIARRTFVIASKIDLSGAEENFALLIDLYGLDYYIQSVSSKTGDGLEALRRRFFDSLGIIRVYSKHPGKPLDADKPFILKRGSTLLDFAAEVHKDFVHRLRSAKAWGKGKPDGIQIARDYILEDGDIVELHE